MWRRHPLLLIALVLGFGFLYLPIISLVVYSFNESRLVTVWGGFSTHWYGELLNNRPLLNAAWLSIKIAALNATLAVVLGTLAAIALARFGKHRGHKSLGVMVTAPLVIPEIVIGLSLLLLFVTLEDLIGWPAGRGQLTILLAHVTFSMAYVTVIVQSRLKHMDRSLEDAALDLGARPLTVFFTITLPLITPALIAGWLLAFTLSMDDLVVASFVSGPGATTLPMVIYSSVRLGVNPQINALATIMIAIVSIAVLLLGIVTYRREIKKQQARP